ncbi:hypothetical protein [Actinoallomurus soli]|uniref:hypothetical protein n=1 Tax=Actinoallomurus soli TaxID=2952535 RepID=UPI002092E1FB|nr:hypothetical protein [Actinoallomurus soli]MCO5974620.1 hypothetical protein [Actinoallomurus soli]
MDFAASAQNAATDAPPAPGRTEEVDADGLAAAVEGSAAVVDPAPVPVLVDVPALVGEVGFPADPPHPESIVIMLIMKTATTDGRISMPPSPCIGPSFRVDRPDIRSHGTSEAIGFRDHGVVFCHTVTRSLTQNGCVALASRTLRPIILPVALIQKAVPGVLFT